MSQSLSVTELLAQPKVIAGFRQAYDDSDVGGSHPFEQGGFLLRDSHSGEVVVTRLPSSERDSMSYPLCPDGQYQGQAIVGSFHTHPNTGKEWRQEPSPQDIRLAKDYPETMGPHQFVISRDTIYHIDNNGVVTAVGRTADVLKMTSEEPKP